MDNKTYCVYHYRFVEKKSSDPAAVGISLTTFSKQVSEMAARLGWTADRRAKRGYKVALLRRSQHLTEDNTTVRNLCCSKQLFYYEDSHRHYLHYSRY